MEINFEKLERVIWIPLKSITISLFTVLILSAFTQNYYILALFGSLTFLLIALDQKIDHRIEDQKKEAAEKISKNLAITGLIFCMISVPGIINHCFKFIWCEALIIISWPMLVSGFILLTYNVAINYWIEKKI
jgi:hypothetical protein